MTSKLAYALILTILFAAGRVAISSADTVAVNRPLLLDAAQQLNSARLTRVNAELALQKAVSESIEQLYEVGYSSTSERSQAANKLEELQALREAVRIHDRWLRGLVAGCSSNPELKAVPSNLTLALTSVVGPDGRLITWMIPNSQRTRSVLQQLAPLRESATGRISALLAEADYLRERLERLHTIDDGSLSIGREIQLSQFRLEIVESRRRMGQLLQRYHAECGRLEEPANRGGFPIEIHGLSIGSPAELMLAIDQHWWQQRQIAAQDRWEGDGNVRRAPSGHNPPLSQLAREQIRCSQLCRRKRQHLRLLSASKRLNTANRAEVARTRLELGVLEAQARVFQEAKQLNGLVAQLDRDRATAQTQAVSTARAFDMIETILETRSGSQGNAELAQAELRLVEWRLARLESLHHQGYASWQEVAIARRDAAIANSVFRATREETCVAKLELQCIKRALDDFAENEDGPLAILGYCPQEVSPPIQ